MGMSSRNEETKFSSQWMFHLFDEENLWIL
jgi:hypothetical protein